MDRMGILDTDDSHLGTGASENPVSVYPASFNQQRLWFLYKWDSASAVYNLPIAYRLRGALNQAALLEALNEIVRRHESLRTTFAERSGQIVQAVAPASTLDCRIVDVVSSSAADRDLDRCLTADAQRPFSLETGPLVRASLFRIAADDHVLLWTMHHIVGDGWSCGVFFRELQALYEAFCAGAPSPLPDLPIQFADYAVWQAEWLNGAELDRQRAYWKQQLAGMSTLDFPTDHPRPKIQRYRGSTVSLALPVALSESLNALARSERATLFMTLAAALQTLLHRHSAQDDIALGIPIAGRNRYELEGLIGFFANTLVMRGDLSGDPAFRELLRRTREAALGAYSHQDLPFETLVDDLNVQRDTSRNPLFQVMFAMQAPGDVSTLGSLAVSSVPARTETAKFDMTLYLTETSEGLRGSLEYNTDLFDADTMDRLVAHFRVLLEGIAADPAKRLSELPLLTPTEERQLLVTWNETGREYPGNACVQDLVQAQAERTPAATAVTCDNRWLTYADLNTRANQLAHHLHSLGAGAGTLIGISIDRSPEMAVALLAVLKCGAAYVPLDPAFPQDRLAFMAADAGLALTLTTRSLAASAPEPSISLDAEWNQISLLPTGNPRSTSGPDDIAYVLYTSGSTGKPKGVEIPHRALTNFLWSMKAEPGCTDRDTLLAVTSLSFDIAGLELWLPLIVGGRVDIVSRRTAADGRQLKECMERCRPTIMQATPSTWRMLIDAGWSGTPGIRALCGGEELPRDLASQLLERVDALWNMYGPTETTIWSSIDRVRRDEPITIGRPIANTQFFILDGRRQIVPVGVAGELFIGGDGLARGYRNRQELTDERFIAYPHAGGRDGRLYRTGDSARYAADGRVVHLGRLDHQVKLRGFRIELGEIEAALAEHESVRQAVVVIREDRLGDRQLTAYVVCQPDRSIDAKALRQHLRLTLPDYMVPSFFVELPAFPLTPNGKVDRRSLPEPDRMATPEGPAIVAPRTAIERRVAHLMADLLGVPEVGVHDDFFERGGHSLKAIQLISRLADAFHVEIPLQVLFATPTIEGLARELAARVDGDAEAGRSPRTPTERRLLEIWQRVLNVPSIGVRDSLLELQGASDALDRIVQEVRKGFGVFAEGLPISAILEDSTIEALARIIDARIEPESSLLVPLQSEGTRRPLFLVHAGGGYVFFYRALAARLGGDRPVYGIRAETEADGLGRPFDRSKSLKNLAARYISSMKSVQPKGPYRLGGACFGGVVAFEMARQLQSRGEQVAGPVLLFDAFVENNPYRPQEPAPPSLATLHQRIAKHLVRASDLQLGRWYILRKALANVVSEFRIAVRDLSRRLRGASSPGLTPPPAELVTTEEKQIGTMKRFMAAAERLLDAYTPGMYTGSIVLFKAAIGKDPEPLWTSLSRGGTVVHTMAGEHLAMLEEPAVMSTAALAAKYLVVDDQGDETAAGSLSAIAAGQPIAAGPA